jgi:hypothetical protein
MGGSVALAGRYVKKPPRGKTTRRFQFCCFEQILDKKPSALAEQRNYEGDFVEVFLAAFFLATFFFVAPAFFLATDTSSEMRKLWLPQVTIIRSSR